MKIKKIRIQNLLSFESVDFNLYDFNVVAGPNASGKTNLLRILNFIQNDGTNANINFRRLGKRLKSDHNKESCFIFELELSKFEATMLMYAVFNQDVETKSIPDAFRKISIGLYWEDVISDESTPLAIFKLGNGFSIVYNGNSLMCVLKEMPIGKASMRINSIVHIQQTANNNYQALFQNKYRFGFQDLFLQEQFRNELLKGNSVDQYFILNNTEIKFPSQLQLVPFESPPKIHQKKLFDFTRVGTALGSHIDIWTLLTSIISQKMTTTKEIRPSYNELAKILFDLKTVAGHEVKESLLATGFSKIFPNVMYDARTPPSRSIVVQNEPKIMIRENEKVYPIEESSSGYFEVLYLLSNVVHAQDSFLILDEPALHLHPPKIRQLARSLRELVTNSGNQVLLITHSPYFVDYSLVAPDNKNAGISYIRKENGTSTIFYKPDIFKSLLKPHLFRPELFFSKCNILVEGPGDYATLAAISEGFGNILDVNDIELVYTWGKGNIKTYLPLLDAYQIPYFGMTDSDYDGPKQNLIILEKDLEYEFRKLGWDVQGKYDKILPVAAYEFVSELMKTEDGKKKIQQTPMYSIVKKAISYTKPKITQ